MSWLTNQEIAKTGAWYPRWHLSLLLSRSQNSDFERSESVGFCRKSDLRRVDSLDGYCRWLQVPLSRFEWLPCFFLCLRNQLSRTFFPWTTRWSGCNCQPIHWMRSWRSWVARGRRPALVVLSTGLATDPWGGSWAHGSKPPLGLQRADQRDPLRGSWWRSELGGPELKTKNGGWTGDILIYWDWFEWETRGHNCFSGPILSNRIMSSRWSLMGSGLRPTGNDFLTPQYETQSHMLSFDATFQTILQLAEAYQACGNRTEGKTSPIEEYLGSQIWLVNDG